MQLPPFEKLAMPSPRAIAPTAMTEGCRAGLTLQASAAQRVACEPCRSPCDCSMLSQNCSCLY